jgi:hypothetical protein
MDGEGRDGTGRERECPAFNAGFIEERGRAFNEERGLSVGIGCGWMVWSFVQGVTQNSALYLLNNLVVYFLYLTK